MNFPFTKMHGLGNDFVVFDFTESAFEIDSEIARKIADRHFGIGCDQILIVENSDNNEVDFKYRIFNADGSEVEQCGNGARCFAAFIHQQGISKKNIIKVETISGQITLELDVGTGNVKVDMGVPRFQPADIPLDVDQIKNQYELNLESETISFSALSMGNPHAVLIVDDIANSPVDRLGPILESHPIFPERANIGFMQLVDQNTISLRVFERGVGETIACGTGACAAVVSGIKLGELCSPVKVRLQGGDLEISWAGNGTSVFMSGPTSTVYTGTIEI